MAYDVGKLVRADNSLNMAVGNALRIDEKAGKDNRTRIQRNSMMEIAEPIATEAVSGYNSYFKIVDVSEVDTDGNKINKIAIVDGYDRGYNRCKVNNKVYDLQYHTEAVTATSIIALRFSSSSQKVEYFFSTNTLLPDDNSEYSYCQLGTVTVNISEMTIQQDHLCGIAQMFWYDICGD